MLYDLTMNNPDIKRYFSGENSYIPTSELLYIHTHPLIKDNFVHEINMEINRAGKKLVDNKVPANSKIVIDIYDLTLRLGESMGTLEPENPKEVLRILREIYQLCKTI